jgi:hypothetical protein
MSELAEEHGHKLLPAGESLGAALGTMLLDRLIELPARNQLLESTVFSAIVWPPYSQSA